MKKRILSLVLALMLVLTLIPAAAAAEDKPERGVLTYTEHIKPQYEEARQFSEDLAAVKKNGKWGYIGHDNKVVIPFQYELAYDFSEGYAVVAKSSRQEVYGEGTEWESASTFYEMGFIDKAGKYTPFTAKILDLETGERPLKNLEIGEWQMDSINGFFFYNGYAVIASVLLRPDGSQVELGEGMYYPTGPVTEGLVPVGCGDGAVEVDGGGWADPATGKVVKFFSDEDMEYFGPEVTNSWGGISQSFRYVSSTYPFNQGLAPVWIDVYDAKTNEYSHLCGIMNRSFQWVIQPKYASFFYHDGSDGLREVFGTTGLAMMHDTNDKYGAIDKTGAVKIPFEYDQLQPISEGFIPFIKDGKAGYLDAATLAVVIPAQYEKVSGFSGGMAVVYDGAKAFLIDRKGDPIPGADALKADTYFKEDEGGAILISSPGEYVVIEKNGKYGFGHIEYLQPLPEKTEMSDWAYEEVTAAIENDLVPGYLQNLYLNDIKRGEMCDVVIQAMEAVLDKDIAEIVKDKTGEDINNYQHTYPFKDSTDLNVLAANKLGIVLGKGDGIFDPYANITRQEAATMLMRAAKVLNMKAGGDGNTKFTDSDQVADWAAEAVEYICKAGIMNGTGEAFEPDGTYSREQSFMTIYRLFQRVMGQ